MADVNEEQSDWALQCEHGPMFRFSRHLVLLRRIEPKKIQDGAAIIWRDPRSVNDAADTAAEAAAAPTASTTKTPPRPSATTEKPHLHDRREGGQLIPVATMRGHSGVNTWRLAVHEFDSRSSSSSSDELSTADATDSKREEQESGWRGLTLMATGGNDGTCKFWDLEFEGACERRHRWEKRWD